MAGLNGWKYMSLFYIKYKLMPENHLKLIEGNLSS